MDENDIRLMDLICPLSESFRECTKIKSHQSLNSDEINNNENIHKKQNIKIITNNLSQDKSSIPTEDKLLSTEENINIIENPTYNDKILLFTNKNNISTYDNITSNSKIVILNDDMKINTPKKIIATEISEGEIISDDQMKISSLTNENIISATSCTSLHSSIKLGDTYYDHKSSANIIKVQEG